MLRCHLLMSIVSLKNNGSFFPDADMNIMKLYIQRGLKVQLFVRIPVFKFENDSEVSILLHTVT